ncbi:MAG: hypothetical protein HQ510_03940 [Candidatus Marinimicrobia bacterium]|nr:hypothetical protein [Candidatus Neomarinimicrobiota bacterium]
MGYIIDYIKKLDDSSMNELAIMLNKNKKVKWEDFPEGKFQYIINNLYLCAGLTKTDYDIRELEKECLKITANKLKVKDIDWGEYNIQDIIEIMFLKFQGDIQKRLSKMSKKKVIKLTKNLQDKLESDGKTITATGIGLAAALAAGEGAGFALFTSTAVGLKALGLLFGTTFAFTTYNTVMAVLGVVFGPVGFLVAGGVIASGLILRFISQKRNRVVGFFLSVIIEIKTKEEEKLIHDHVDYAIKLIQETKNLLPSEFFNINNIQ